MATQVEIAVSFAKRNLGSSKWKLANGVGLCQRFVDDCYVAAGMPRHSVGSAINAQNMWMISRSLSNIPIGAAVYTKSPTSAGKKWGHVGIYVGGGQIISHLGVIKSRSIAQMNAAGYTVVGWGWNGGKKPTGAGSAAAAVDASSQQVQETVAISTEEAKKIIHIPQVEQIWTLYETDSIKSYMDDYQVSWQSIRSGVTKDITSRISGLTLTDDVGSLCQELSFAVVRATDGVNVDRIDVGCGDYVAVVNHGSNECIFLGQVQATDVTTGEAISVRCLDQGRILTANEIILQCNNIPAKTAIEQAAAKAGIKTAQCPNLISTVYNIYKDSASNIIQNILETASAENGVGYFPRMMGDTLVIRSFGREPIKGYYKQASNLTAFDILDNASAPSVSKSIEDLRNAVVVYSEADETVSIQATLEDAESIKRYGRRQALETYSDQDTVSATAKAKTALAALKQESEEVRLTTYGSDKIVAGCMLRLAMEDADGDYWVTSVTHSLGTPHMMDMTLRRVR